MKNNKTEIEIKAEEYCDKILGGSSYRLESPNHAYVQKLQSSFIAGYNANINQFNKKDLINCWRSAWHEGCNIEGGTERCIEFDEWFQNYENWLKGNNIETEPSRYNQFDEWLENYEN